MFNIDDFSECVKTLDIAINVYLHLKILVATVVKMSKKKFNCIKCLWNIAQVLELKPMLHSSTFSYYITIYNFRQ